MKNKTSSSNILVFIVTIAGLFFNTGCASFGAKLKAFLGGQSPQTVKAKSASSKPTVFSDQPYHMPGPKRQYRRVTKQTLQNESHLEDSSGSLWVNEGQGAYLFSQNIMRMIGDPIAVRMEGEPKQQLVSKVSVIKKLLEKLEARRRAVLRGPASGRKEKDAKSAKPGAKPEKATPTVAKPQIPTRDKELSVKTVPTRIVERLVDGNYRIKGSQPIMIGSREYKVIVTGIVRAEDFSDEGISATELLDPKFDIVSPRRREN